MPKDYKPPKDANDLFARYKAHYEGERELKPAMREMAARELKAGATVGQLAKWTGLTPEVFRRMARDLGVERKRPPTVGKLKSEPPAQPEPPRAAPPPRQPQRWQEPPVPRTQQPPPAQMTDLRARNLADLARSRATPQQLQGLEQSVSHVGEDTRHFAFVAQAASMGLLTEDEMYGKEDQ